MAGEGDGTDRIEERPPAEDGDLLFRDFHDDMQRRFLRQIVSDEVIEEHRRSPLGQHSEPLARLLHFFRTRPLSRQYAVLRQGQTAFRIVALSGRRGTPPQAVDDRRFETVEATYHAIFLMQIKELLGT